MVLESSHEVRLRRKAERLWLRAQRSRARKWRPDNHNRWRVLDPRYSAVASLDYTFTRDDMEELLHDDAERARAKARAKRPAGGGGTRNSEDRR
jgi:hypothetical protein